jgi:RsiW-degrading membrane proteinase PrsW (M82 family)
MTTTNTVTPHRGVRRFAWVGALVAGVGTYAVVLSVMVSTQNLNFFPSLLLVGAITVPLSVLIFALTGGRTNPPGGWLVAATAISGGVIGTVTAGVLEFRAVERLGAGSILLVGFIEEAAKLVVPLVVLLATRPRDPRAGVVIGIASGMGFAVLETMGYGFQELLRARSVAAVDDTLLLRALLSPAGHVAWTGLTVAMLWRIPSARRKGRALLAFAGAYLLAVVLHTLWDASSNLVVHVVVVVVSVTLLLVLVHRTHTQHRGVGLAAPR